MQLATKQHTIGKATFPILFLISIGHFINDSLQAVVPAIFPILQKEMDLSFTQIGLILFILNMTSSVLQPAFGYVTDKKPLPFLLGIGMLLGVIGMVIIGLAPSYIFVLIAVIFVGLGSAIFHPEGSRVSYLASGPKRGLGQSIFQVGGNLGNAMAPLFSILIFVPLGQHGAFWFIILPVIGIFILTYVGKWYKGQIQTGVMKRSEAEERKEMVSFTTKIKMSLSIIIFITFIRSWYNACIGSFSLFYLMNDYHMTIQAAQICLFTFMLSGVAGTIMGGALSDRFGKKNMIVFSMLASSPFAVMLPIVSVEFIIPIFVIVGFIISTSFSTMVVYAQTLLPGHVGLVSGLVTGLAFGLGALGAVALGGLADLYSLKFIMVLCGFFPLLGIISIMLPNDKKKNIILA